MRKVVTLAVRESKQKLWEDLVVGWNPTVFRQTKYFDRPSAVYVAKDRVSLTSSKILQVTFLWMRMKSFYNGDQDQSNRSVVEWIGYLLLKW